MKTAKTVTFSKISTPRNWVKLRYFTQCSITLCKYPRQIILLMLYFTLYHLFKNTTAFRCRCNASPSFIKKEFINAYWKLFSHMYPPFIWVAEPLGCETCFTELLGCETCFTEPLGCETCFTELLGCETFMRWIHSEKHNVINRVCSSSCHLDESFAVSIKVYTSFVKIFARSEISDRYLQCLLIQQKYITL